MQGFKVALLVIIAIFLLVIIVDRSREPQQMKALVDQLNSTQVELERLRSNQKRISDGQEDLTQTMDRLSVSLDAFQRGFEQGVVVGQGGGTVAQQGATQQNQSEQTQQLTTRYQADGIPREGVSFLLPYDRSSFDEDKLAGEYKGFAQEPTTLNTIITSMGATSSIVNMVSDSLATTYPERPGIWHQALAKDVQISDNFTKFVFTLRQGVMWQIPTMASEPGKEWLRKEVELTAHDFVFFLQMVNNSEVDAPHLRAYYANANARAIDDFTLEVTWTKSEYTNIQYSLNMSPVARHIYTRTEEGENIPEGDWAVNFNAHWFDRDWGLVGTGPYRLSSFEPKKAVKFARNNSYWGVTDHFETVHWDLTIVAPEPQLLAFKNNQVHSSSLRPNQWKAEVLDQHENRFAPFDVENPKAGRTSPFGWEIVGQNRWYGICWNTRRPQLSDKRVRQALAYAYDFDRVKSEVFFDLAIRSKGPVHPNSDYANKDTLPFMHNLEKAAALLDEAGWTDTDGDGWRDKLIDGKLERLSIDVTYYGQSRTWANLVSLYADTCKEVGVEIVAAPVEDQEWARRADNRDFDGFMVVWTSGLEVDFKQLWHSDGATEPQSSNYASYANPKADVGIDALRETFEPQKRYEIAASVADQIYQDQPYLFISVGQSVLIWHNTKYESGEDERERLGGLEYGFDNYHPLLRGNNDRWYMSRD